MRLMVSIPSMSELSSLSMVTTAYLFFSSSTFSRASLPFEAVSMLRLTPFCTAILRRVRLIMKMKVSSSSVTRMSAVSSRAGEVELNGTATAEASAFADTGLFSSPSLARLAAVVPCSSPSESAAWSLAASDLRFKEPRSCSVLESWSESSSLSLWRSSALTFSIITAGPTELSTASAASAGESFPSSSAWSLFASAFESSLASASAPLATSTLERRKLCFLALYSCISRS
mmetsp:Transcript_25367/g.71743  ORF Transcript_25367/g.71743 Transcript_25367/m.71743 type:complete len:231 (+) Transcript_25367:805-1497(+)